MRSADFYLERGLLSLKRRDYDAAAADLAEALKLNPEMIEAWCVRGNIRNAQGHPFDALLHYDRALGVKPDAADIWNNRGLAFADLGNWPNAEQSFRKSIELADSIEPHMNLANLYAGLMRLGEAAEEYRAAVAFEPGNHEAHLNLGVTMLGLGQWEEGFKEYFWRHRGNPYPPRWARDYPQWQGESLAEGDGLLLYPEQGYGDEILFARVCWWLRKRFPKARVDLATRAPLAFMGSQSVNWGLYTCSCSTIDVLGLLGYTPRTMPLFEPYIHSMRADSDLGGHRLPEGFKVGLCWSSGQRPLQPDTRATSINKSIPLIMLRELLNTPGVSFVSLQKEHGEHALMRELGVIDLMSEVHSFADTAALIKPLDLVISVDTAVAHLAGAMGKPVWNLVRFAGYWPWLAPEVTGDQAIWYPSMRLYRQPQLFNWAEPINRIRNDLKEQLKMREAA